MGDSVGGGGGGGGESVPGIWIMGNPEVRLEKSSQKRRVRFS